MEVIRARGVEIAFERAGSGPPLVLVHGAGDDSRAWRPQLEALADACSVVAWDEPGSGRSSDIPPGFSLHDYADCLAALVEAIGGPATVGGISWGGTIVLELYRRHPRLVAALVLADTYAGWKGSLPEPELRDRVTAARAQLDAPPPERDGAAPEPFASGLFAGGPPAERVELLREMAAAARRDTLRTQVSIMAATDQRDVLPRIAAPTLLIWGEHDARSPVRVAHEFERAIPGSSLVLIPECGHLSNLERPDAFNRAVREFCSSLRG